MLDDERVRLAAISYERGFDVDDLLLRSSAELRSLGLRIGGLIQLSAGDRGQCAASIHVVDLCSGQAFDIWEPRGACARGCRLDERGLLDAEQPILAAIADRVDLLIINRFGRAESLGRGLIDCFAAAMEGGVPVLTAVRAPHDEAWQRFHGGSARELTADLSTVVEWALAVRTGAAISPSGEHTGRAELAGL